MKGCIFSCSDVPLFIGLNTYDGYMGAPYNSYDMDVPYLFFGFLPLDYYGTVTTTGLLSNGISLTMTKSETTNEFNYMALYPGFQATGWYDITIADTYALCSSFFNSTLANPSGRVAPDEYFMFYDCELFQICYANTYSRILSNACIITAAIGFR